MIITGIAHPPARLYEKSHLPSTELVYLAAKALKKYKAAHLVTSLSLGWEQALAKAALELDIPFTVAIPYPGRDSVLKKDALVLYYELLARAAEVYQISDAYCATAVMESNCWRVDHADGVLALWNFEFHGDTFQVIDYALKNHKEVVNLWRDWEYLFSLRRKDQSTYTPKKRSGAQVF